MRIFHISTYKPDTNRTIKAHILGTNHGPSRIQNTSPISNTQTAHKPAPPPHLALYKSASKSKPSLCDGQKAPLDNGCGPRGIVSIPSPPGWSRYGKTSWDRGRIRTGARTMYKCPGMAKLRLLGRPTRAPFARSYRIQPFRVSQVFQVGGLGWCVPGFFFIDLWGFCLDFICLSDWMLFFFVRCLCYFINRFYILWLGWFE